MLRLAEAQNLHDAMNDESFAASLAIFFHHQAADYREKVTRAVCQPIRDTMREARLAGKVEAYEEAMSDLRTFAREQLKQAAT